MCQIEKKCCLRNNLITAVRNSKLNTVKALLDNGFDVNVRDSEKMTALMITATSGHKALVQLLIDYKAKVNAQSKDGWTALHYAILSEEKEIVELLLKNKANPDIKNDKNGYNALEWAIIYNLFDIAKLLKQYGAKVHDEHVKGMVYMMDNEKRDKYYDLLEVP